MNLDALGLAAKKAAGVLNNITTIEKNNALLNIAEALIENSDDILNANAIDVEMAKEKGITKALLDRLTLTKDRILDISNSVKEVAELPDPIGEVLSMIKRPNGILIGKKRVPLGVIAIIYEARPNVTVDAAVLCLKSSNATILRGGSEAIHSNTALVKVMQAALLKSGLPELSISLVEDTSRETAQQLMRLNDYVDVLIPRGGAGLIKTVLQNATVPIIETGTGNCHVFVDESADLKMGVDIIVNSKMSRPSVCNAAETLLVHEAIAEKFLPMAVEGLKGVELRACEKSRKFINAIPATEDDYKTEFNDYILAIKVVSDVDEAIEHINKYNTKHSESIVTNDYNNSQKFLQEVDAAAVYINASTRFTDGGEFGFGAEIGISTQKMHARGPMGLNELTSIKYIIYGNGQVR